MTPPRDGFGAHDRNASPVPALDQPLEVALDLPSLHVIREASKRSVPPAGIDGIGARPPQAPEPGHVPIRDSGRGETRRKIFAIELRIVARPRYRSDIDEFFDTVSRQDSDECFNRPGGMANGADREPHKLLHRNILGHEHSLTRRN